jgi:hypothetical protein
VAEDYVRPPILAIEPPSRRAAVWRFRAVMAVIVVILAAGVVFAIRAMTGGGEGGASVGLPAVGWPAVTSSAAAAGR